MFFQKKPKGEFINQSAKDDYTCEFLSLINAFIHAKGNYPEKVVPKYNTKAYFRFINLLKGANQKEQCEHLADLLQLRRVDFKEQFSSQNSFGHIKKFIIEHLKKDVVFDMTIWSGSLHSCLIVDWNEEKDSFKFVNAGFFSSEIIEWLPLEIVYGCSLKKNRQVNYNFNHSFSQAKANCSYSFLMDSKLIIHN